MQTKTQYQPKVEKLQNDVPDRSTGWNRHFHLPQNDRISLLCLCPSSMCTAMANISSGSRNRGDLEPSYVVVLVSFSTAVIKYLPRTIWGEKVLLLLFLVFFPFHLTVAIHNGEKSGAGTQGRNLELEP